MSTVFAAAADVAHVGHESVPLTFVFRSIMCRSDVAAVEFCLKTDDFRPQSTLDSHSKSPAIF